jgi:hypothetical protein
MASCRSAVSMTDFDDARRTIVPRATGRRLVSRFSDSAFLFDSIGSIWMLDNVDR